MVQELEEASNAMGYGAVKYADLKNQRMTNYKFDFDEMLKLQGNTAVYLLYAHARIAGIVRKAGVDVAGPSPPFLPSLPPPPPDIVHSTSHQCRLGESEMLICTSMQGSSEAFLGSCLTRVAHSTS